MEAGVRLRDPSIRVARRPLTSPHLSLSELGSFEAEPPGLLRALVITEATQVALAAS